MKKRAGKLIFTLYASCVVFMIRNMVVFIEERDGLKYLGVYELVFWNMLMHESHGRLI